MNNLSWLIYFADVLPGFGLTLAVLSLISLIIFGTVLLVLAMAGEWSKASPYWKWIFVPIVGLLLAVPIPAKETIYMIAASEVGEEALATPEVAKIRMLINKYLDEQNAETEK